MGRRRGKARIKDELSELMEDQRRSSWYGKQGQSSEDEQSSDKSNNRASNSPSSERIEKPRKKQTKSKSNRRNTSGNVKRCFLDTDTSDASDDDDGDGEDDSVNTTTSSSSSSRNAKQQKAEKKPSCGSKERRPRHHRPKLKGKEAQRTASRSAQKQQPKQQKRTSKQQLLDELSEIKADQKGKWYAGESESEIFGTDDEEKDQHPSQPQRSPLTKRKILCSSDEESSSTKSVTLPKLTSSKKTAKSNPRKTTKGSPKRATPRKRTQRKDEESENSAAAEAKAELEELKKDEAFRNRSTPKLKKRKRAGECEVECTVPPIPPLCFKCSKLMDQRTSSNERSAGKIYFKCFECNDFLWADHPSAEKRMPVGPLCRCRPAHPSVAIRDRKTTRVIWVCPNTNGQPCNFEKEIDLENDLNSGAVVLNSSMGTESDSDKQFLVGGETLSKIQGLFHLEHSDQQQLRFHGPVPQGYYDYLKVEYAWKLEPSPQTAEDFNTFRDEVSHSSQPISLRSSYNEACEEFTACETKVNSFSPLRKEVNELLLIHGTKPSVVAKILEESLDPGLARVGLFGSGTYFAEHPAKINQYVERDEEWKGGKRHKRYGTSCALHNKLFPRAEMHPGNVFYALVCRVVLGDPFVTAIHRSAQPPDGHHSLLAEPADQFREFVVFDKRAIKIEYLVCFQRTKRYCGCGDPLRERTIAKQNHRPMVACNNSRYCEQKRRWVGGCGFFSPLPRCFCRSRVDFYPAERQGNYFVCQKNKCGFREMIEQGVDLRESEDEDDYDYDDGFLVED